MNKVIKFSAAWCGPCKAMKPQFEKFQDSLDEKEVEGIELVDLDVDQNHEEASKYGVRSIPFTIFIKNDEVKKSLSGMQTASQLKEAFTEVYLQN
jgi:thioredoxin 1